MKVAVLGPEGTFTHQAAHVYFDNLEPAFYSSLIEVFESDIKTKIVPFENSLGGSVDQTIDLLKEKENYITNEQIIKISLNLVSIDKLSNLKRVYSHPKAFSQCQKLMSEYQWETIEMSSTAKAAQIVGASEGAIASKLAAQINNLNILKRDVQDKTSYTRFLILNDETKGGNKTSFILEPGKDYPGLLKDILSCFADRHINLSYIQSRPTKNKFGEYFFYLEAEVSRTDGSYEGLIDDLKKLTRVKVVGTY
ncbi:MAG: prephenate dehydratase [Thermoplasmatota archaeon]